jgi:hypothetical protein
VLGDKNVSREQLNILGRLPFSWWDDSFIAPDINRTYVLTRTTQVDTVQGLDYGYYVFTVYGEITPELSSPVVDPAKRGLTVTSATFFKDDDSLYCGTTAERAAQQHLNNLRNANSISVE